MLFHKSRYHKHRGLKIKQGDYCLSLKVKVKSLSHFLLFVTPWTEAYQTLLFMEFPRQEYWSEFPFPPPGDRPDQGTGLASSALAGRFFTTEPPGKEANMTKLPSTHAYDHLLFSLSVTSDSLQPHGLQHSRLPCPSPSSGACSNSCALSQ